LAGNLYETVTAEDTAELASLTLAEVSVDLAGGLWFGEVSQLQGSGTDLERGYPTDGVQDCLLTRHKQFSL
jgi:hypothetical protein